jgi:hypothetical protein
MLRMADGTGATLARRSLLGAAAAALVLPAGGCGIRLEEDAPHVPFVPTRTPVPAEDELVALTLDTRSLADAAAALPGPLAADLATLHRHQHAVLRTALAQLGVPADELDRTAAPSPTASTSTGTSAPEPSPSSPPPSPSSTASPRPDGRLALARDEGAAAASAGSLADVAVDLRATVAALHAQRYAAAALLSGRVPTVPRDPVDGADVAALASLTAAAIFLMEVVAARSEGRQRTLAGTTLEALRDLRTDQLAGGATPDEALGHPLPFPVDSPVDAARLARTVLGTLRSGSGQHLEPVVTAHGAAGMAAMTRWVGAVEVEAHRWGIDLQPFPGLS